MGGEPARARRPFGRGDSDASRRPRVGLGFASPRASRPLCHAPPPVQSLSWPRPADRRVVTAALTQGDGTARVPGILGAVSSAYRGGHDAFRRPAARAALAGRARCAPPTAETPSAAPRVRAVVGPGDAPCHLPVSASRPSLDSASAPSLVGERCCDGDGWSACGH